MLVIAEVLPLPTRTEVAAACGETFAIRATAWPPTLGPPPESWAGAWSAYVADYGIQYSTLASAYEALNAFWQPILGTTQSGTAWDAESWTWS